MLPQSLDSNLTSGHVIPVEVVAFIPAIQLRLNKEYNMNRREAEDMEQDEVGLVEQEIACLPTNLSREDIANRVRCNTSLLVTSSTCCLCLARTSGMTASPAGQLCSACGTSSPTG